jgi:hypothetical protein
MEKHAQDGSKGRMHNAVQTEACAMHFNETNAQGSLGKAFARHFNKTNAQGNQTRQMCKPAQGTHAQHCSTKRKCKADSSAQRTRKANEGKACAKQFNETNAQDSSTRRMRKAEKRAHSQGSSKHACAWEFKGTHARGNLTRRMRKAVFVRSHLRQVVRHAETRWNGDGSRRQSFWCSYGGMLIKTPCHHMKRYQSMPPEPFMPGQMPSATPTNSNLL